MKPKTACSATPDTLSAKQTFLGWGSSSSVGQEERLFTNKVEGPWKLFLSTYAADELILERPRHGAGHAAWAQGE